MATKLTRKHKAWTKYANEKLDKGQRPTKFKDYETSPVYFKSMTQQSPESRLKAAGIDWNKDKSSAKLKRKAK